MTRIPSAIRFTKPNVQTLNAAIVALIFLFVFLTCESTCAQTAAVPKLKASGVGEAETTGFGVRVGPGVLSGGDIKLGLNAYYQVPIGSILFSPEITVLTGGDSLSFFSEPNSSFAFDLRFYSRLLESTRHYLYLSYGIEFMVWGNKGSAGLPLGLSYLVPLADRVQLELMPAVTPMVFLSGEKPQIFFGIFAGLRFPGPDDGY